MRTEGGGVEVARTAGKRWVRALASTMSVSVLALMGLTSAAPAQANVPAGSANYSGYASGTDVHTGALTNASTTIAEVDQAFSGAAVNSQGLNSAIQDTDLASKPLVQAAASGKNSGARGSGVEVGVAPPSPLTNQIILSQEASATAAPNSGLVQHQIALNLDPILSAGLLEGQAQANWNTGGCVLGEPISQGEGHAANAKVLGGPGNPVVGAPGDAISTSAETLVPQTDKSGSLVGNGVGLMSSVVENVAPVVLANNVTITVVGPWRLQAVATGVGGASYVNFGPTNPAVLNGTEPALTIQVGAVTTSITFQQLLGANGLALNLGLVNLDVATPPHAIGSLTAPASVASDGTSVSAAADIVTLQVNLPGLTVADLRIGHMTASATVPSGGIACPIPVTKTANPQNVNPGDSLTYTITVSNPFDCTLNNVKVVDTTTASSGVRFAITGENPTADSSSGGVLTWNNLGSIKPGGNLAITVNVTIDKNSSGGTLTETANVTGSCGIGNANGTATVDLPLNGSATIQLPTIGGPGQGAALPVTGGLDGRYYAVALLIGLAALGFGRKGIMALFKGNKA